MTLALAILGTILGVANLVLGVYTLIIVKVQESQNSAPVEIPFPSKEQAREIFRKPRESEQVDEMGMPDTYDPGDDPDFEEVI